jgi:hypothetical protein
VAEALGEAQDLYERATDPDLEYSDIDALVGRLGSADWLEHPARRTAFAATARLQSVVDELPRLKQAAADAQDGAAAVSGTSGRSPGPGTPWAATGACAGRAADWPRCWRKL